MHRVVSVYPDPPVEKGIYAFCYWDDRIYPDHFVAENFVNKLSGNKYLYKSIRARLGLEKKILEYLVKVDLKGPEIAAKIACTDELNPWNFDGRLDSLCHGLCDNLLIKPVDDDLVYCRDTRWNLAVGDLLPESGAVFLVRAGNHELVFVRSYF